MPSEQDNSSQLGAEAFSEGVEAARPLTIFAGPCAIESLPQLSAVAECISSLGLHWLRGGAFKPRTSPHSFQGLGEEGLDIMRQVGERYRLQTLSEVIDSSHVPMMCDYVDGLQIGTRNMANYSLLSNVGEAAAAQDKLVFFKRGMAATISEWLSAAEYITGAGARRVVLCERGLRTFETSTRYTLDISAVPVVQKMSMLPICVDVSHPAGRWDLVAPLARAAVAAGADALMIEVHPDPAHALSDGPQQLNLERFADLVAELRALASFFGREVR